MNESPRKYSNLSHETHFRLNEINEIKDYYIAEIRDREPIGKKLSKYIAVFDYFDKVLIDLSAASGAISTISFFGIIEDPIGIESASFSLAFSLAIEIVEKYWKQQETTRRNITRLFTAWKVSKYRVFLVRIFLYSDWIQRIMSNWIPRNTP